jgi:hypothetical protein
MNGAGFYDKLECDLDLVDAGGNSAVPRYILIDFGVMTQLHFSDLLWLPLTGDLFQLDTAQGCNHNAVVNRTICPFIHHVCRKWADAPALAYAHTPAGIAEQRFQPPDESNVCAFTSATLLSMTLQQLSRITAGCGALKSDLTVSQELAAWLRKLVTKAGAYKGWRQAGAAQLKQLAAEYAARSKRKAAAAAPKEATDDEAEAPAKAAKRVDFGQTAAHSASLSDDYCELSSEGGKGGQLSNFSQLSSDDDDSAKPPSDSDCAASNSEDEAIGGGKAGEAEDISFSLDDLSQSQN